MSWIGALLGAWVAAAPQQEALPTLLVLPLKGGGVDEQKIEMLEEQLASELDRYRRFNVLGTSDLNAMLGAEQLKDAIGCDDVICAAEIGGAMNSRYLVAGRIDRLAGQIVITLKLIDSEQNRVAKRSRTAAEDAERLYASLVADSIAELLGEKQRPRESELVNKLAREEHRDEWLAVRARAEDPEVPWQDRRETLKEFLLESDQRNPYRGDAAELFQSLKPATLSLSVAPTGATVEMDGDRVATLPQALDLEPGPHTIVAEAPGFLLQRREVTLEAGQQLELELQLAPHSPVPVQISSNPVGADLSINKKPVGAAPHTTELLPGDYNVVARLHGYWRAAETIRVLQSAQPEPMDVVLQLDPLPSSSRILGHSAFWVGTALSAFGVVAGVKARAEANLFRAGDAGAADRSRSWAGGMYGGLGAGLALMTTGILVWLLAPDATRAGAEAAGGAVYSWR